MFSDENDAHLIAVRYVELNPVAADMFAQAENWVWSSARSHIAGRRMEGDQLTDFVAFGEYLRNLRALLHRDLALGDRDPEGESKADAIEALR